MAEFEDTFLRPAKSTTSMLPNSDTKLRDALALSHGDKPAAICTTSSGCTLAMPLGRATFWAKSFAVGGASNLLSDAKSAASINDWVRLSSGNGVSLVMSLKLTVIGMTPMRHMRSRKLRSSPETVFYMAESMRILVGASNASRRPLAMILMISIIFTTEFLVDLRIKSALIAITFSIT
jgi:hypothetical protein